MLPEVAEFFLLTQQQTVLPQVEALQEDIAAKGMVEVNKKSVKAVKNKKRRLRELETK